MILPDWFECIADWLRPLPMLLFMLACVLLLAKAPCL